MQRLFHYCRSHGGRVDRRPFDFPGQETNPDFPKEGAPISRPGVKSKNDLIPLLFCRWLFGCQTWPVGPSRSRFLIAVYDRVVPVIVSIASWNRFEPSAQSLFRWVLIASRSDDANG